MSEAELRSEIARLEKIIAALIDRAETPAPFAQSDFGIFQASVLLEDQVLNRTHALKVAWGQLEETNRALRESRAELQAVFELMPNPVAISTPEDETLLGASRSFADFFGSRPEDMTGRRTGPEDLGIWTSDADRERFIDAIERNRGWLSGYELDIQRPDGTVAYLEVSGRILDVDNRRLLLKEFHDITDSVVQVRKLRNLAEHDSLTGLPNRRLVYDRVRQALATARRNQWQVAICYLDLDGFKDVNDRYGHRTGDMVLQETAHRLNRVVRASDTVGRLGGDEFALVLVDVASEAECEEVFERLLRSIAHPFSAENVTIHGITISIGYTLFPRDEATPDALLSHADQALYQAKRKGKNCFHRH